MNQPFHLKDRNLFISMISLSLIALLTMVLVSLAMMAYANQEALGNTVRTGNAWFWSTSRKKLWMKGEESGNVQPVHEILVDCDSDAILYMVDSDKPACHTGNRSCFHNVLK